MLLQVATPANDEIVEHANTPTFGDQTIDEVTSDKARATGHKVKHYIPSGFMDRTCQSGERHGRTMALLIVAVSSNANY
jgi:hypothetical protein